MKKCFEDHLKILTAIESGDPEFAKQAMREHLDYVEKNLLDL
jgi:DNA-binding FadR family transcriptional regulator